MSRFHNSASDRGNAGSLLTICAAPIFVIGYYTAVTFLKCFGRGNV